MSSRKTNENSNSDSSLTISITLIFVLTYGIAILGVLITKFKFLNQQSNPNSKAVQPIKEVCSVEGGRRAGTFPVHSHSLSDYHTLSGAVSPLTLKPQISYIKTRLISASPQPLGARSRFHGKCLINTTSSLNVISRQEVNPVNDYGIIGLV